jgi:hypothetical protein
MSVRNRRFTLLAVGLVALNLFLWLAPPGLAVRDLVLNQIFGNRLIRAEVVVRSGPGTTQDYLVDRGVITAVAADALTLREADGKLQTVPVTATTQVSGLRRFTSVSTLRRNLRVLVVRPANGPATLVRVEGRAGAAIP